MIGFGFDRLRLTADGEPLGSVSARIGIVLGGGPSEIVRDPISGTSIVQRMEGVVVLADFDMCTLRTMEERKRLRVENIGFRVYGASISDMQADTESRSARFLPFVCWQGLVTTNER